MHVEAPMKTTNLFLHIPKTAGITMHQIAGRQYRHDQVHIIGNPHENTVENFAKLPQQERDGLAYVGGHFSYGFHELFTAPCRYVTMLRDPAEATLSMYHYIRRCKHHPLNKRLLDDGLTFVEWLRNEWYGHLDNYQLRCLIGRLDTRPMGTAEVERGQWVLEHGCCAFGLVDRFDESLLMISDAFGWHDIRYRKANVYSLDGDERDLTAEARDILASHHALGFKLLGFARALFERRIAAAGPAFSTRLAQFRSANQSVEKA
jgi:hypothetical protein